MVGLAACSQSSRNKLDSNKDDLIIGWLNLTDTMSRQLSPPSLISQGWTGKDFFESKRQENAHRTESFSRHRKSWAQNKYKRRHDNNSREVFRLHCSLSLCLCLSLSLSLSVSVSVSLVCADSTSRGGDVAVYVLNINQLSFSTPFYFVLVSISVFMALSHVCHSISSCDTPLPRFLTLFFRSYLCLTGPFNYIPVHESLPQP